MDAHMQRWIVAKLTEITDGIVKQSRWMDDDILKSAYMVAHVAMSAAMFGELPSLAQTCGDWCAEVTERMKVAN